ncbi:DUF1569 domain-containing protein [Tautonia plasticadhaerens]|uniref:DUF1569 domain-containing protein n=1 Tax=Tautonia plasticadhaerens TaxID=2527974 RepID=A0A518GUB5_9BACT|nr:DUF1569 domain-containing protein [Tautonia plasticadhaerens]QDV32182.1 hypothetical protein ElP_00050 [Tautonia plasticadhaerens]
MPDRRPLRFDRLDDVPGEVDRLLLGHRTVGGWSLAQICSHLAAALRLTAEAPSGPGPGPQPSPGATPSGGTRAQATYRRLLFRSETFPEGVEMPSLALHPGPPEADPLAAASALRDAVSRFLDAPGPFPEHPMLGAMDREQWLRFHRIHCAHHLSFVLPPAPDTVTGP